MSTRPVLLSACVVALAASGQAPAHAAAIRQLDGSTGCFEMRGEYGCAKGNGTQVMSAVAVAPGGRHVYATSGYEDFGALLSFRRNPATGALSQFPGKRGCISNDGRNGQANLDVKAGIGVKNRCADGRALAQASALQIAPDGRTIYVLGTASFRRDGDSVAVLRRDPQTGAVSEIQCWSRLKSKGCHPMPVSEPGTMALTPDGRELILGGGSLTTFKVGADGKLSAPACVLLGGFAEDCPGAAHEAVPSFAHALAASPDGNTLYAAYGDPFDGQLVTFARDPATGVLTRGACFATQGSVCARARALKGAGDLAVTASGIYVAASALESPDAGRDILHSSALLAFTSSPFAQLPGPSGCLLRSGADRNPGCGTAGGLREAFAIALTPDGTHVLATFADSGALVLLARDAATQALSRVAGPAGCVAQRNRAISHPVAGCRHGRALLFPFAVAVAPDARNAYAVTVDGLVVLALR
jgi:6-phosphogluconolactonase (cycloisomerase 2 family)